MIPGTTGIGMGLTIVVTNARTMGGTLTPATSLAVPAEASVKIAIRLPFHKATATPLQNGFVDGEALWRLNNPDEFRRY